MKVILDNIWCHVEGSAEELEWLDMQLRWEDGKNKKNPYYRGDGYVHLLDRFLKRFPAGFLRQVVKAAAVHTHVNLKIKDVRRKVATATVTDLGWLRDYQHEAVDACLRRSRMVVWAPTGSGKCLGPNVRVLLADGGTKRAAEVVVGDLLMGPDSTPRTVLSTTRGEGSMFRIVPTKGEPWECNDVHVLTLVHTETGEVSDIPLDEYIKKSKWFKHLHKLFQPEEISFKPNNAVLPIDPYILGVWLGDGTKSLSMFHVTTPEPEIRQALVDFAPKWDGHVSDYTYKGRCPSYAVVTDRGKPNRLLTVMRELWANKDIPMMYLTSSRNDRLELLAGLLDTDGYIHSNCYEFVQKNKSIADGVEHLARSLGMRVTRSKKLVNEEEYHRLSISGNTHKVPCRVPRKRAYARKQAKNALRTGFKVKPLGIGPYAGFTLDSDGRFLLGDFTVTHNTEIAAGVIKSVPRAKWLFLAPDLSLIGQTAERFKKRLPGVTIGTIGGGKWSTGDVTVATFQTLYRNMDDPQVKAFLRGITGAICDECHTLPSKTFLAVVNNLPNAYYRIGLSGTPMARGDEKSMFIVGALGQIGYRIPAQLLIDRGYLARPTIYMVNCEQESPQLPPRPVKFRQQARWRSKIWAIARKELIVESDKRNNLLARISSKAAKPALMFVDIIEHGKTLEEMLRDRGLSVEFVNGKKATEARETAIKRLEYGDTDVLISTVFNQGVDIPELRSCILAGAGKSAIKALQRVGRGMRVTEDKDEFEVWDVNDDGTMLKTHAKQRIKAYGVENYEVKIVDKP